MLGCQDSSTTYRCGPGGVSPRVPPLPIACPTAYHPWWRPEEAFWKQRQERGWRRQPVPQG